MQLFNFFYTENTSKTAKNGSFCGECLSENDFETVLVNFCCYKYGANAFEADQKINKSLLPAYWRYKPGLYFFPDK